LAPVNPIELKGLPAAGPAGLPPEQRPPIIKPWQRLRVKFALFATLGVLAAHVAFTIVANRAFRQAVALAQPVGTDGRRMLPVERADYARRAITLQLGLVASGLIMLGVLAAFAVGGRLARPVGHIVATLRRMDPTQEPVPLPEEGQDEIGFLVHRFNEMRHRLFMAHLEEEQIRRERLRMEKLAALGTLIAGVAHEINNPLAGLKNCVQRLGREGLAPERRTEYLELMRDSLNRIQKVVAQLLHYSRTVTSNRVTVRVNDIVGSTEQFLQSTVLRDKNLEKDLTAGDAWVQVDSSQIEQALTNLIINALYVTPPGGSVQLKIVTEDDRVGFRICDQGPGIPEEIRNQVEDPFFTTKPEGEGTGMGLYVTRNIADSHRGDLTFDFPENGGTAVTLWLPLAEAPSGEKEAAPGKDRVNPTQELKPIG
jgi:two-component system, NtrC family, sensor kinase